MKPRKPSSAMVTTLKRQLPVLFVHIGWANYYDGTEAVKGNFSFLIDNPKDNSESLAFLRNDDGWFYCGIGMGTVPHEVLHIVLDYTDPCFLAGPTGIARHYVLVCQVKKSGFRSGFLRRPQRFLHQDFRVSPLSGTAYDTQYFHHLTS